MPEDGLASRRFSAFEQRNQIHTIAVLRRARGQTGHRQNGRIKIGADDGRGAGISRLNRARPLD